MIIDFCPDCNRVHESGLWACPEPPETQAPLPTVERDFSPNQDLIPRPKQISLSERVDAWTVIYERNLLEFAVETGGVPTKAHVRRAEELADREIRRLYAS